MSHLQDLVFNLPLDIIFDILVRLPVKSLIQFRCVSTSSRHLISHPSFTKLCLSSAATTADRHLLIYYESTDYINQFYSFRSPISFQGTLKRHIPYKTLHGYLRIAGSDKGLICFFDTNFYSNVGSVILWNPSINKSRELHHPHHILDKFSHFIIGFGFVLRNFEFKVVEIAYHLDNFKVNNDVLVYSLSTNSWKKLDTIAPCYLVKGWSSNVFVNGFVNWLACKEAIRGVENAIMVFDLDNESFHELGLPNNIVPNYDQLCLVSYGESSSVSLCAHYFELDGDKWDMWVMGNYGFADSWNKVCVVSHPTLSSISPLLMRNDDEVLIVMNDGKLVLFDAIKNAIWDLATCGLATSFLAISYTSSLALFDFEGRNRKGKNL